MPITPFRRRVDAVLLDSQRTASPAGPSHAVNKWEALRSLAAARAAFGLSDRDVTVLQALLSFHPSVLLGEPGRAPVVFPSNKSLCERLNGMACSTMRRHLARLVAAGLLIRRDSPNGKRYARRAGGEVLAFGFDLSPLIHRLPQFRAEAARLEAEAEALAELRRSISLMRRDAEGLAGYGQTACPGAFWDSLALAATETARLLRRKLDLAGLRALERDLARLLEEARQHLDLVRTEETGTSAAPDEQHIESPEIIPDPVPTRPATRLRAKPGPDLGAVLRAAPRVQIYAPGPLRSWADLIRAADTIRPMLGIPLATWNTARGCLGPGPAAICLAAILQRFGEIQSPGAYLARLCEAGSRGDLCLEAVLGRKRAGSQL